MIRYSAECVPLPTGADAVVAATPANSAATGICQRRTPEPPARGRPAAEPPPLPQWRKWRRPVKTIAKWCRSATSIAISSRIEPPGWMIAVTPASAAAWIPSGNGK